MTENNCIVLKSFKQEENGRIVHEIKSDGKDPEKIIYADVRGGLAWTVGVLHPCYCIVGQITDPAGRKKTGRKSAPSKQGVDFKNSK